MFFFPFRKIRYENLFWYETQRKIKLLTRSFVIKIIIYAIINGKHEIRVTVYAKPI